jgi:CDP-diacylglycerol--serine O-phosphatidyltransferase
VTSTDENKEPLSARKRLGQKGIYLLPNLFTTAALFSGFYAVVAGMDGNFVNASIAIFVAMILDGLDGRVARMTNTQSDFGAEYDSLSDMVSFGVAPALVAFSWSLQSLGKLGWIAAFIYVAGAALRLARFNTQLETADKRYFTGLASPAAAALVAGAIWVFAEVQVPGKELSWMVAVIVALSGILMVSNVRYYSFKDLDFKGKVPFFVMLILVAVFAVVSLDPAKVLWAIFVIYALSGLVYTVWSLYKERKAAA